MNLVFRKSPHHLQLLSKNNSPASSLKIFDEPLVIWNINKINKTIKIEKVSIPEEFQDAIKLVQERFSSITVEQFSDSGDYRTDNLSTGTENKVTPEKDSFEMPINSVLVSSQNPASFFLETIKYPWDFLNAVKKILVQEVTQSMISKNAVIANSTIIEGPCIIEDNVKIDDFCKIKGPVFIGRDSFIGMGSLVRNSMLSSETRIGFNCEISKTYFGGHDQIAHHNVILDSVIGENVWFGGYSGTANVLLTRQNIRYMVDEKLTDTGTDHFGSVVGNNCAVGAAVIILPGRQVPADTQIQAGTIFGKSS